MKGSTMTKHHSPNQIAADRRALVAAFPRCFAARGVAKVPLKIGIRKDIVLRGVAGANGKPLTWQRIEKALADYTTGPRYAQAMVKELRRIDLDGETVLVLAEDHPHVVRARMYLEQWAARKEAA